MDMMTMIMMMNGGLFGNPSDETQEKPSSQMSSMLPMLMMMGVSLQSNFCNLLSGNFVTLVWNNYRSSKNN